MIDVLIVDPQCLYGTMMATVLQNQPGIRVIGYVPDALGARREAERCAVMLVSAELAEDGALKIARALRAGRPKVLITGLIDSPALILSYIEAGAAGYILRDSTSDELIRNIRAVHAGQVNLPGSVVTLLVARMRELLVLTQRLDHESANSAPLRRDLTERERVVLALLARGLTNQEIGAALVIEAGTVKNHVHNILKKLHVSSRIAAARYFLFNKSAFHAAKLPSAHELDPPLSKAST
jgi:DNA-binding NarL/FixJ family response regulator